MMLRVAPAMVLTALVLAAGAPHAYPGARSRIPGGRVSRAAGPGAEHDDAGDRAGVLLGSSYPLRFEISFHAALFHWIDSLAGTSGGKTVPAHVKEFVARTGGFTRTDSEVLNRFRRARLRDANRAARPSDESYGGVRGLAPLRRIFLEAPSLAAAEEHARSTMEALDFEALHDALLYFRPKYEPIWQDGAIPRRFLKRFRKDAGRKRLEALLVRIARFYGVDPAAHTRPVVVLVPVPSGYGTHATAVGPYLLIEVRPPDRLADQASVIVHENSHFLFSNIDADRRLRLEGLVGRLGPRGRQAWQTLREALPTALGQGVADRDFRPGSWSTGGRWYHRNDVDAYAKALYPLVRKTLEQGGRFDEAFVKKALALYPGTGGRGRMEDL
jgi:hypothetical protein